MRKHLLVMFLAIGAISTGCQSSTSDSGTAGDEATLSADDAARRCGATTCTQGEVCCNASCGICTAPGDVCIQLACEAQDAGKTCTNTQCGPRETCMETRRGPQCVPHEENPCNLLDCPPNATCQVVQGAASCVPVPSSSPAQDAGAATSDAGRSVTPGSCALVLCPGICRDVPGGFVCEPIAKDAGSPEPSSCAVTLCPAGTYCDDLSGTAKCIKAPSCDKTRCDVGQHCELQPVQCIRAPCPPQPRCVPDVEDPCAAIRCAAGTHCEVKEVQCIRAPCPPIAECVADDAGATCGKTRCGPGSFCCNESCGICAPKGGGCIQVFCPAES